MGETVKARCPGCKSVTRHDYEVKPPRGDLAGATYYTCQACGKEWMTLGCFDPPPKEE